MANLVSSTSQIDIEDYARILIRYLKERKPEDIARDIADVRTPTEISRVIIALQNV